MVAVAVVKLFFQLQMKEVGLEWQPKDHFAVAPQEDWVPETGMNNLVQQRMRKRVPPNTRLSQGFLDSRIHRLIPVALVQPPKGHC